MKKAALIFCALALLGPAALAALGDTPSMLADGVAQAGGLEVRMLDGGFSRAKNGLLFPEARLAFQCLGSGRRFRKNLKIELVEVAGGKRLASWSTFVSLKPGKTLSRRYGRESLARWDKAEGAPALALRVLIPGRRPEEFPLPLEERFFNPAPGAAK